MRTLLALCLVLAGCAHGARCHRGGKHACAGARSATDEREGGFGSGMSPTQGWTTVRIDEPDGAHVHMEPGAFSDGIDVLAPFQATFQPTAREATYGYPLEIELDAATAARYGASTTVRLRGQLTVPESKHRRGILRIAPNECALRALLAGDLDVLRVSAEELPTAEAACAGNGPMNPGCPMMGQAAPMMGLAGPMMGHGQAMPHSCPMMGHGQAMPHGCPMTGHGQAMPHGCPMTGHGQAMPHGCSMMGQGGPVMGHGNAGIHRADGCARGADASRVGTAVLTLRVSTH